MAARIEQFIREQLDTRSLTDQERLFLQEELERFEQRMLSPEFLSAEWERQVNLYLDLDFHKYPKSRKSRGKFKDSMPRLESQPQEYRGRLDLPLLVVASIPWEEEARISGIAVSDYLRSQISETKPFNENSKPPEAPYTGWFNNWGQRFTEKIAPIDARKQLKHDEVGASPHEGIAVQIAHPEFTSNGKYYDLIGYKVGSGRVPGLGRWNGAPRLGALWVSHAGDDVRPLVRGSKIVTE